MRGVLLALLMITGWTATAVPEAAAQDLIELFRQQRFRAEAERIVRGEGRYARPMPPAILQTPSDTIRYWAARHSPEWTERLFGPPPPPPFDIHDVQVMGRFQRGWFEEEFGDGPWAFLGTFRLESLDTLRTHELRARMEAHFGPPSHTLVEVGSRKPGIDVAVQFAYWFVVNDSIPVIVSDVSGPLDRGLVFSTEARFSDRLPEFREALLGRLISDPRRAPYVDYYFHVQGETWYRVGFDGMWFFMDPIRTPDLTRGRPHLPARNAP
jgi:hypothetical protein